MYDWNTGCDYCITCCRPVGKVKRNLLNYEEHIVVREGGDREGQPVNVIHTKLLEMY